ncbi:hypothetical protein FOCC_FOCC014363 [Frankliniella occidentalis]|nr:hypothetical protein FOCC_FOCC014363 [Frankliniella occidentalis]
MIVYDVDSNLSGEELDKKISEQNFRNLNKDIQTDVPLKAKFKTGPKEKAKVHWLVEVAPGIRQFLIDQGRLYLGWKSHKVTDYLKVPTCQKCRDLGHMRKYCQEKGDTCKKCGEKGHKKKECTCTAETKPNFETPK